MTKGLVANCLGWTRHKRANLTKARALIEVSQSLGVLPDNAIRLFIGVEGRHDIAFLKNMARILRQEGSDVLDLEQMELDGEVIFFPLGGSSLALWTSRLAPLARPEFHLFDRDCAPPKCAKCQADADRFNTRPNCKAVITGKKEMENYLHYQAINEAYENVCKVSLGLSSNFSDFDDVPALIAELVHGASDSPVTWASLDKSAQDEKERRAKRILNEHAALVMTKERLDDIDPNGHVMGWFGTMKALANS